MSQEEKKLSGNSFDELLEIYKGKIGYKAGSIIEAEVKSKDKNYVVFFNSSLKSESTIPINEFPKDKEPQVGEKYSLYVVSLADDGKTRLSYLMAEKELEFKRLEKFFINKEFFDGIIESRNKTGFQVNLGKLVGFLPFFSCEQQEMNDLTPGQTIKVKITKMEIRQDSDIWKQKKSKNHEISKYSIVLSSLNY